MPRGLPLHRGPAHAARDCDLDDIEKNTVAFVPNYDDRLKEPTVLPARLPNLLVNGSSGIAVGMATNIPPHNLGEVAAAVMHLVDNPEATIADLMKLVKGPDFPTGAFIYGREGIKECYKTGRGRMVMRARAAVEEKESSGRSQIIVNEIPFQVNKARLIEQIAELARDKKIGDISDLRDESDRDGMRIVIELKRDANPSVVLNQLYKHSQMQATFGAIMLALTDGQPKVMNLKELLEHFIEHRHEVITRRTKFDLDDAEAREHLLQGLKIAVDNIDDVVEIIKKAKDVPSADAALRKKYGLSEKQSDAILNMRLARLTALEVDKLEEELKEIAKAIKELKSILASKPRRMGILKKELDDLVKQFGIPAHRDRGRPGRLQRGRPDRRGGHGDHRVPRGLHQADSGCHLSAPAPRRPRPERNGHQGRRLGGTPVRGLDPRLRALFHPDRPHVLAQGLRHSPGWPGGARQAGGQPDRPEAGRAHCRICAGARIRGYKFLIFVTAQGTVKKTVLSAFGNPRSNGINAINIEKGDELIDVQITDGSNDMVLATSEGMSIRFHEKDVREMGRAATGVRGIELDKDDRVIGMVVVRRDARCWW